MEEIQFCVLEERILLTPFGVPIPESFSDVRPLEPRIDKDSIPVCSVDEFLVIIGRGTVVVPRSGMHGANPPRSPESCDTLYWHGEAVSRIEIRVDPLTSERRSAVKVSDNSIDHRRESGIAFAGESIEMRCKDNVFPSSETPCYDKGMAGDRISIEYSR
jgi:hypothetical protein